MAIKLEKTGDSHRIDLRKQPQNTESLMVHVNLDWEEISPRNESLLGTIRGTAKSSTPDLDLGCMYEMLDGEKGVIQPLGGNFGSKTDSPYIFLDKDDRTGATDGENMYLVRPDLIKRVLFFGFIYAGVSNFKTVRSRMIFQVNNEEDVYLELDNPDPHLSFCAAALIQNIDSQIVISKEERYFRRHDEADHFYEFGFNWRTEKKE